MLLRQANTPDSVVQGDKGDSMMWVLVLEDSDLPTRSIEVHGPFDTEKAAQDKLFEYFQHDVVHVMGRVIEVTKMSW